MGIEFDGSYIKGLFGTPAPKETKKASETKEVSQPVPVGQPQTKEIGDKLLDQVMPTFVKTAQISKADAVELTEMFAMAGIKNPKMPTAAQYASVAGHVSTVSKGIDELTTTNNAERLFNSDGFKTLDEFFA